MATGPVRWRSLQDTRIWRACRRQPCAARCRSQPKRAQQPHVRGGARPDELTRAAIPTPRIPRLSRPRRGGPAVRPDQEANGRAVSWVQLLMASLKGVLNSAASDRFCWAVSYVFWLQTVSTVTGPHSCTISGFALPWRARSLSLHFTPAEMRIPLLRQASVRRPSLSRFKYRPQGSCRRMLHRWPTGWS